MGIEQDILKSCRTIAVIGLSADAHKASHRVSGYLLKQGYKVIPVNPNESQILGQKCYPSLTDVPEKIDVVNIFRKSEDVPPVVEEAIKAGVKAVWIQEGIINEESAQKARQAGVNVVMDRCILKEHVRMQK